MTCPCLTCPAWATWCKGTVNAMVSHRRETGETEAQRLVAATDDEPGQWERETAKDRGPLPETQAWDGLGNVEI